MRGVRVAGRGRPESKKKGTWDWAFFFFRSIGSGPVAPVHQLSFIEAFEIIPIKVIVVHLIEDRLGILLLLLLLLLGALLDDAAVE